VAAIAEAGKAGSSVAGPMVGKMLNFLVNGTKYEEAKPVQKKTGAAQ
jgi:penicillin-binding protein 2